MPITIEISGRGMPTTSEIRAPQISSVSTDRPFSSVPSQYSARRWFEDAAGRLGDLEPLGVGDHRREIATSAKMIRTARPTRPAGVCGTPARSAARPGAPRAGGARGP